MSATVDAVDIASVRAALAQGDRPRFWRSLAELADTPAFREFVRTELPRLAERLEPVADRRKVLKLLAAALAMGGLAGCQKAAAIMPYVRQPGNAVAGRALHYATALQVDGYGLGAIVESHEGRPTKVEGNPDHPGSLGATDAIMQAACLGLFDPERSRSSLRGGNATGWNAVLGELARLRAELQQNGGAGFVVLFGTNTSPTRGWLLDRLHADFPAAAFCPYDPLQTTGEEEALAEIFHQRVRTLHRLERAKVIVSLDADFLGEGPARLADARSFANGRILRDGARTMSRLHVFESTVTLTGAAADHRWPMRASQIQPVAEALAARLAGSATAGDLPALAAIADDLRAAGPNALMIAGAHQPAAVHRLVHAMNAALQVRGVTVDYITSPEYRPAGAIAAAELVERMNRGAITSLLVLDGNPVHSMPADLGFARSLAKVGRIIHWGPYADATAAAAHWHIPAAHDLERWGDIRAFDGTASIVQPLIAPLYGGRTAEELLAALLGENDLSAMQIVRGFWQTQRHLDDGAWARALQTGIVADSASVPLATGQDVALPGSVAPATSLNSAPSGQFEVRFIPDPWLRAGAYANNAWLLELPRPLSKLVWGNAAHIAPADAERLAVVAGDVLHLDHGGRSLEIPAWIDPGQPAGVITLSMGFGQKGLGDVGEGIGVDVFPFRLQATPWIMGGVTVRSTGARVPLITTQSHQTMEGRDLVRSGTLAAYLSDPTMLHGSQPTETLYGAWPYVDESWGMVIDQTACIGCMACVAACQAENNIPSVGADECARGHEMHWLRIDRYYTGDVDTPEMVFQPVPCMHCEDAPCEEVCPVNATVHTHDGLNAQVYNRCVGTRYCSQNCPYKVRRFNFLEYNRFGHGPEAPLAPLMNPDVSVRSRGVMEKCTYCVQRIEHARIDAEVDDRKIRDGDVVTACQQACPTRAITFGDLNDRESSVRRLRDHPLDYTLLAELNTRPHTTYLARIKNPDPRITPDDGEKPHA
jgi:molybdopterin-containing oxidoreductase family iron-sulfur binding subunit